MKQNAVDWLEQEFIKLESTTGVFGKMYELLEQAKAMEKEQIDESFKEGFKNGVLKERWEQTYGGDK